MFELKYTYMLKGKLKRGDIGEKKISELLESDNHYYKLINNLVLTDEKGMSHQVDHILIRENGVFSIETKNYYGKVTGGFDIPMWQKTYIKHGKQTVDKFVNPLKQNKSHVRIISKTLGNKYPIINFVVFVQNNVSELGIFNVCDMNDLLKRINIAGEIHLSKIEIDNIYKTLLLFEADVNQTEHVSNINEMKKTKKQRQDDQRIAIEKRICPICGSHIKVTGMTYSCLNCGFNFSLGPNNK